VPINGGGDNWAHVRCEGFRPQIKALRESARLLNAIRIALPDRGPHESAPTIRQSVLTFSDCRGFANALLGVELLKRSTTAAAFR